MGLYVPSLGLFVFETSLGRVKFRDSVSEALFGYLLLNNVGACKILQLTIRSLHFYVC